MTTALAFRDPDPTLEAAGNSPARRAARARRAAQHVLQDRNAAERDQVRQLNTRLTTLQGSLKTRLLADDGGITDFRRFNLTTLLHDVDRLVKDTTTDLGASARSTYRTMANLGEAGADEPIQAAQLIIRPGLPGLDAALVGHAFDNTLDLLTQPMQQFGSDVKVALRGVALAGDNKFEAIQKLRDKIAGQGFDNAQYRAERIIRTELGRIFNQATFTRLLGLALDFPFLRKGWRATGDARTRLGHVEAGRTYSRGSGIPITAKFTINVYQERPGEAPKHLGTATLLFPIDPAAEGKPAKLAAAATIMCRCNGFVDFDLADFAEFTRQAIQTSLGGILPPLAPGPTPVPSLPPVPTPRRPRAPRKPKPPATPDLGHLLPSQAAGVPVSKHLILPGQTGLGGPTVVKGVTGKMTAAFKQALALIDRVHGDGTMSPVLVNQKRLGPGTTGQYASAKRFGDPVYSPRSLDIDWGKASTAHPINTMIHETGHYLDEQGFGGGNFASPFSPELQEWRKALKDSPTYQQLESWRVAAVQGRTGQDGVPTGAHYRHLAYLVSAEETFARSYAQYVAVRSGDPVALAELRVMQRQASFGPVSPDRPYNSKLTGAVQAANSWDYPTVWGDDEFEPIARAFDRLFEARGWRKK